MNNQHVIKFASESWWISDIESLFSGALEGPGDFVTGYLKYIFNFIGVHDIQFIDATQLMLKGAEKVMNEAQNKIQTELLHQPVVLS